MRVGTSKSAPRRHCLGRDTLEERRGSWSGLDLHRSKTSRARSVSPGRNGSASRWSAGTLPLPDDPLCGRPSSRPVCSALKWSGSRSGTRIRPSSVEATRRPACRGTSRVMRIHTSSARRSPHSCRCILGCQTHSSRERRPRQGGSTEGHDGLRTRPGAHPEGWVRRSDGSEVGALESIGRSDLAPSS
jgi:hypothetical protein